PKKVVVWAPRFARQQRADFDAWFREAAGDAEVVFAESGGEFLNESRDADVVLGRCYGLNASNINLRWVQRYGVGVERCLDNPAILKNEVVLTNGRGLSGPYIAEHVITMTMMLSHGMLHQYRNQQKRNWDRNFLPPGSVRPVWKKEMLVVGLGGIGTKVAEKAHGLGMRVKAIRNSRREGPDYVEYVGLSHELDDLTQSADFVVNTLPLTSSTQGIYDQAFFEKMKSTAYFLNVGRGASVVTQDLVEAIQSGSIAGAGLDVFDPEPLPKDHALWGLENVIVTPHNSGRSGYNAPALMIFVRENLRRYTRGEALLNVVDKKRGY
ncbi:MAG: D-2-hydroxyacid dehydrogenase, partial [Pseudomonadota bacterium]